MRSLLVLLFLVATTAAQSTPPVSPAPNAPTQAAGAAEDQNAAKARAIIDQMIAALGGQAYLTYQDLSQEGRTYSFYQGQPQGSGTVFWRFWKWPDKDRFEYTKQRDIVQIYNADDAFEITFRGTGFIPKDKAEDYRRRREHSLEHVLRDWLKQPGVALFYEGQSIAEQKTTDQVTIMTPQNDAATLYIDVFTHLPIKKNFIYRDPQYRDRDVDSEVWGNYRTVQGIATPFTYSRTLNGEMVTQRYLTSASYNAGLPDEMFVPRQPPPGKLKK